MSPTPSRTCALTGGGCDPVFESCVDTVGSHYCQYKPSRCPAGDSPSSVEECLAVTCADQLVVSGTHPEISVTSAAGTAPVNLTGTYVQDKAQMNRRPIYVNEDATLLAEPYLYITFDGSQWNFGSHGADLDHVWSHNVFQHSQSLCPSTAGAPWMMAPTGSRSDHTLNLTMEAAVNPCDTIDCPDGQQCRPYPGSQIGQCVDFTDHCGSGACNGKGETCVPNPWKPAVKFPHVVEQGRILGTVGNWGPKFGIQFDLMINGKSPLMGNIIQVANADGMIVGSMGGNMPSMFVNPNSSSLKIMCGGAEYDTKEYPMATWFPVRMFTMFEENGDIFFHAMLGDEEVWKYKLSNFLYEKMNVFGSSPAAPAAMAEINNVKLSSPLEHPAPFECVFDKANCPADMTKKVKWKGIKGQKVMQTAPGGIMMSAKISNKGTQAWWDIRKNMYTGFFMVT